MATITVSKEDYINKYLNRVMKKYNHLNYGLEWMNKLATHEQEAEKKWEKKQK